MSKVEERALRKEEILSKEEIGKSLLAAALADWIWTAEYAERRNLAAWEDVQNGMHAHDAKEFAQRILEMGKKSRPWLKKLREAVLYDASLLYAFRKKA